MSGCWRKTTRIKPPVPLGERCLFYNLSLHLAFPFSLHDNKSFHIIPPPLCGARRASSPPRPSSSLACPTSFSRARPMRLERPLPSCRTQEADPDGTCSASLRSPWSSGGEGLLRRRKTVQPFLTRRWSEKYPCPTPFSSFGWSNSSWSCASMQHKGRHSVKTSR